ncbi:MAG: ABC transporter ATP-binding protein [Gemmobacter sp.]
MADHGARMTLRGVEKRYGRVTALLPTDLVVEPGEFFSLIGPSGSGKTTLLGAIAGFTPPTRGAIEVDGVNIAVMPPYRRNIGMVFQNYALFPHMTVADNVAFPLRLRKLPEGEVRARVQAMLETVRLPEVGERLPSQLSGGQQQRIALARAAVYNPRILLMDEPLGALDKNLREEMQLEIKAFHSKIEATVLYVTHDQDEAATMSDRLAIMNGGRIVQHGTPRALYEHPANAFVAAFLGTANLFRPAAPWARSGAGFLVPVSGGFTLAAVCDGDPPRDPAAAAICVRPETIAIEDAGAAPEDPSSNVMAGRILDAIYTAGTFRYLIDAGTGTPVSVRQPSIRQSAMRPPGQSVALVFPAAATLLIPKE